MKVSQIYTINSSVDIQVGIALFFVTENKNACTSAITHKNTFSYWYNKEDLKKKTKNPNTLGLANLIVALETYMY